MPTEPSYHRIEVWRELRRIGAIQVSDDMWSASREPTIADQLQNVVDLARSRGGEVTLIDGIGSDDCCDKTAHEATFNIERAGEWREFLAACGKFEVKLEAKIGAGKLATPDLEAEVQSLDRLIHWHGQIKARDVFGAQGTLQADEALTRCVDQLSAYTERVFQALGEL
jgi:hypothetical protein